MAGKPVTLTTGANPNPHLAPEPLIVVGGGIDPQVAPVVDDTPADAAAVAADLQSLVDALVAAGILTV